MFYLDINKTYNQNLGLSQKDRFLTALEKDYFLIDEFDFECFINFISNYASKITFFNNKNILDGDWTSFFNNDPTISLLKVAFYKTSLIQPKENYFSSTKKTKKKILENISVNINHLIKHFYDIEVSIANLLPFSDFKAETEKLISLELSPIFCKCYLYHDQFIESPPSIYQNEFGDFWKKSPNEVELNKDFRVIAKECQDFFKKTNLVFESIKATATNYFEQKVVSSKKIAPHIGLLITFHKIYNEARNNLNSITFKHHDYYLKEILQIPLKSKKPDKVHLSFVTSNSQSVEILKGEELTAGTNEDGKEIIYKIDKTILINSATIKEVLGFTFTSQKNDEKFFLNRFDFPKKVIDFEILENRIGFSFGSEILSLEEGIRKITFEFNFSKNSLLTFHESISSDSSFNNLSFINLFNISYTSGEDWVDIPSSKVESKFNFFENQTKDSLLQIIILIDNIDPPITRLEIDNNDNPFPTFNFYLNKDYLHAYHSFKLLNLNSIDVDVEIIDVKNLLLSNDFGEIDSNAPFEPFGSQPIIDSSFIIGHPTFFLYPINDIKINLEWYGLPLVEGGFSSYYNEYPWDVNNESFEVKVSYLRNKRWVPEQDKQVINLFQDVPDESGAVSNVRRINEINIRDLELHLPSLSKKNMTPYNNFCNDGFLKFDLCYPLEGFGHQQYLEIVRESTMKSVKNKKNDVNPPNEPYTPTLKSISADFKIKMSYNQENCTDFKFSHIHPIGNKKVKELGSLLPIYQNGSTLIISINNTDINKQFSILFQINEALSNNVSNDLMLKWSFNNGNRWVEMNDKHILVDQTFDFKSSGIIEFNLEDSNFDQSGLFDPNVLLIKAESLNNCSFLNCLQDILLHATTASCHTFNEVSYANIKPNTIKDFKKTKDDVDFIQQKYYGFGGVLKEDTDGYFMRAAERLRHKNRAVSGKDYEKIILEKFPKVNRVMCLSNIDVSLNISPGNILIVVVPKIFENSNLKGIASCFSSSEIQEMEKFLEPIVPIGVNYKIVNPLYERVKVKFSLKLHNGFDKKFYIEKLNEGIKSFISPWMYNLKDQVEIGKSISSALILNYIDKQEYVDHIVNFSLFHVVNDLIINQKTAKSNTAEIKPTTLASVLVSDNQHIILSYDGDSETDNFGVNEMMIDTDYVVDYANEQENFAQENLTIEKSYKILPTKEDNNPVSSNFTFYISV